MNETAATNIGIRRALLDDLDKVIGLDAQDTGQAKPDYWRDIFDRYVTDNRPERYFLIAENAGAVGGFIVGEIRAWEFGSTPSGWVFAINVAPELREQGIASRLMAEICNCFKQAGINTVRTMISRNDPLNLSFFRSQGLSAGPYIQLEMHLDE